MKIYHPFKAAPALLACLVAIFASKAASAITIQPASEPLFLSVQSVKPNIMLMIDTSLSMNGDVNLSETYDSRPTDMYTKKPSYSYSCSSSKQISAGATSADTVSSITFMKILPENLQARFCSGSACDGGIALGNIAAKRCFANDRYYTVSHYDGTTNGVVLGTYKGIELNWYFDLSTGLQFTPGSLAARSTSLTSLGSRIDLAKQAASEFVTKLTPATGQSPTIRLGLTTYASGSRANDGGKLVAAMGDLDSTHAATIQGKISAITLPTNAGEGFTPLSETLSDIGRYFSLAPSASDPDLILHPNADDPTSAQASTIFYNRTLQNGTDTSLVPPIQYYCQKSFVVLVSDGLPTLDRNIGTAFQDYDGDCDPDKAMPYKCLPNNYDMKCGFKYPGGNGSCPNSSNYDTGTGGSQSSDYLDDVATALYEMDLRPDLAKPKPTYKNNLVTYTVGFADPTIDPNEEGVNPLLADTATNGGGRFFYAANSAALAEALMDTVTDITGVLGSSASVAANSSRAEGDALIYQARFDSSDWTGSFLAYSIFTEGDNTGDIKPTALWDAAQNIPAPNDRTILTFNTTLNSGKGGGAEFKCESLSAGQKTILGIGNDCSSSTDQGIWLLNYLRGDYSHEQQNTALKATSASNTKRDGDVTTKIYRNRAHLDLVTHELASPDPWVLGDIISSNPAYVGSSDDYAYDELAGTEGTSYTSFRQSGAYTGRQPMVYVGANDGMLHGFNASSATGNAGSGGKEIVAYVPNAIFSGLPQLSSPTYKHAYYVEGSPKVADAYFGSAWHTVLVGTTGAGGRGVFALDVKTREIIYRRNE